MAGIKWNRNQPAPTRTYGKPLNNRAQPAPTRSWHQQKFTRQPPPYTRPIAEIKWNRPIQKTATAQRLQPIQRAAVAQSPQEQTFSSLLNSNFDFGVQFQAPWAMWGNGICEAWRRMARAIAETGTPVHLLLDKLYGEADARVMAEVKDLTRPKPANLFIAGFPTAGDFTQSAVINQLVVGKRVPVVLMTLLERDRIGPRSVAEANKVSQWWLPCQQNIDVFLRAGVDPNRLKLVHIPFFPNDPHLGLVGRKRKPGPTHFYRIGIVDTRKDVAKTLRAWLRAFKPGEDVRLTIKTYAIVQDLSVWKADPVVLANGWTDSTFAQHVCVVNAMWESSQLLELHRQGDVYVTLSHGEGWEMSAYDAVLSGNRMVYTASGGPQEFAAEGDLLVPTSAMVPCDSVYDWEPDARWVDYDLDIAAQKLREAHENPLPKEHRRSWSTFTAADVGKQMTELLIELADPGHVGTSTAARHVLIKWTGQANPDSVNSLTNTYSRRELFTATQTGPESVDEALQKNRTEVAIVYLPGHIPCGVASHVMSLRSAHPRAAWLRTLGEVRALNTRAKVRTIVLEVPLGGLPPSTLGELVALRHLGISVVLDYHHAESSPGWLSNLRAYATHADRVIFYNPNAPVITGLGIYAPLPVPDLHVSPSSAIGGLVFVGFADPSRRIDELVGVADRLDVPIYGYGPHLQNLSSWYDTRSWKNFRPMRSYLNEHEGASEIARHSVALFARTVNCPAYASASARFCIAAGIPVVVDGSPTYADIRHHVAGCVTYENRDETDRVVRRLIDDPVERARALERQGAYAQKNTVVSLLNAMGLR